MNTLHARSAPLIALSLVATALAVAGCSRQDPPAGVSKTQGAADRTSRAGADGSGDGPTAFSPADKARAANASASNAASTSFSSNTTGTSPMPMASAPTPSQGSTNAVGPK